MSRYVAGIVAFLFSGFAGSLHAQYPTKPIRVVVPFAAGSSTDVVARILAQPLQQSMGQTLVIDNRPGADGALAGDMVAKAPADGYTLLLATNSPLSAVPHLRKKMPYDALKDFAPISMVGYYTFLVAVNAGVPVKSLRELFDHARANPGKLNYATGNTSSIVLTAMLNSLASVKMLHVPYKSEPPAVVDLISGQVQVMVSSYATVASHLREGRIRALALALNKRSPLLPNVPTVAESGFPKFSITPWAGMFAPARTPKAVVDKLSREFNIVLKRADIRSQLDQQAFAGEGSTPEALDVWVKDQYQIWGAAMREAGIQPE
ncbi:MAG: tripartite tricarboxylate transporter substrate binding protein [Burkholderiales bacterium]